MTMETKIATSDTGKAERVSPRAYVAPPVDIYENGDSVLLFADLPGVRTEQLSVSVDKGELSVVGERRAESVGARLGREYGEFDYRRTFVLPEGVDASKIEAELSQGVLRVKIPKAERAKPRKIEVKGA
jgi:HSP20 family molecular chaperone IbpA